MSLRMLPLLAALLVPVAGAADAGKPPVAAVKAPAPASKPVGAPAKAASDPANTPVRVLIAASREAKLSAQMEGRLASLPKVAGAFFKQGEVLAEFDCRSTRAELAMAVARLEKAQRTLESQQALGKLNAVSDLDLALAKADLAEARARQQQVEASVSRCTIVAPYAGRVVRRVANQFETLGPGAPVLEIIESGPLRLELLVPSRWLGWLKTGTTFTVHVDEINRRVPARVTVLGSRVDPVSQTVSVQAVFTETVPGVLPGMSGNAYFSGTAP